MSTNMKHNALLLWYISLLILSTSIRFGECGMQIYDLSDNVTHFEKVFSCLPWDHLSSPEQYATLFPLENTDYSSGSNNDRNSDLFIPLIRIDTGFESFDPCDISTYTSDAVRPLLSSNIQNATLETIDNLEWIAVQDSDVLDENCPTPQPIELAYKPYTTLLAQDLGAAGFLRITTRADQSAQYFPPGVDVTERTVFDEKINIPCISVKRTYVTKSIDSSTSFLSASAVLDWSAFNSTFTKFSVYHILWLCIGFYSIMLAIFMNIKWHTVVKKYYQLRNDEASKMAVRLRLLILIPQFISNILRAFTAIDPIGVFYIFDFFTARSILNLGQALVTFTDIVTIIFCLDIYNLFKLSKSFNNNFVPFLVKYKFGGVIVLSVAFIMISVDQLVLFLGLYHRLGNTGTTTIPTIYVALVNIAVIVLWFVISTMMKKEIDDVLDEKQKESTASYNPGVPSTSSKLAEAKNATSHLTADTSIITIVSSVVSESTSSQSNRRSDRMNNPASKTGNKYKVNARTRDSSANKNTNKKVLTFTEYIIGVRILMLLSAFGRLLTVVSVVLVAVGWFRSSAFAYSLTILLAGFSHAFSSTAQVLAALKVPSKPEDKSVTKMNATRIEVINIDVK